MRKLNPKLNNISVSRIIVFLPATKSTGGRIVRGIVVVIVALILLFIFNTVGVCKPYRL